jgi:TolB protein
MNTAHPSRTTFNACHTGIASLAGLALLSHLGGCGSTPDASASSQGTLTEQAAPQESNITQPQQPPTLAAGSAEESSINAPESDPVLAPDTIDVTRVTFAQEGADFDPSVSTDGSRLVFASTQHRATSDIYYKRTDSRVVTQLTNDPADDAMPVISPDGTKVAFASNRSGNWDIYMMPITGSGGGGKAVQVTSDDADEMQPSWSPDGSHLVYSRSGTDGRWEMWVSKAGNNAAAQFIGYGLSPKWSPVAGTGEEGADKILFQLARERGRRSFSIWTLDYTDGKTTNVTEIDGGSTLALLSPAWSPDGRWVTFAQADLSDPLNITPGKPRRTSIWMVSARGEGRVRLTSDQGVALSPVWAGDNTLYYISDRSGSDNIWSLRIGGALAAASAAVAPTAASPATEALATAPDAPQSDE